MRASASSLSRGAALDSAAVDDAPAFDGAAPLDGAAPFDGAAPLDHAAGAWVDLPGAGDGRHVAPAATRASGRPERSTMRAAPRATWTVAGSTVSAASSIS